MQHSIPFKAEIEILPLMPRKDELRRALGAEGQPIAPQTLRRMICEVLPDTPYTWAQIRRFHYLPPLVARKFYEHHGITSLPNL